MSAARLMATVLGADELPHVTVPHPISSASPDDLVRIAQAAAIECVKILTGPPPAG